MDGHVVARGIVPAALCTPQAFAQINLNIAHLVTKNAIVGSNTGQGLRCSEVTRVHIHDIDVVFMQT
jgi:hypothetical protein